MSGATAKSIIITGAASGIGFAAAMLLAKDGCALTLADVNQIGGNAAAAWINNAGDGRAQFIKTDVSDADSASHMVEQAVQAYGRVDGAINCAGVAQRGKPVHELSIEDWHACLSVNLQGMFLCLKYEIAAMLNTGGGSIVAVSSAAAIKGLPNSADYCASKAGITGLVRGAALDYAQCGVRINALLPGGTDTPLARRSLEANPILAETVIMPMGRMAQPEEVAAAAVWLISDQASYMTGASICIDGGLTIV